MGVCASVWRGVCGGSGCVDGGCWRCVEGDVWVCVRVCGGGCVEGVGVWMGCVEGWLVGERGLKGGF